MPKKEKFTSVTRIDNGMRFYVFVFPPAEANIVAGRRWGVRIGWTGIGDIERGNGGS